MEILLFVTKEITESKFLIQKEISSENLEKLELVMESLKIYRVFLLMVLLEIFLSVIGTFTEFKCLIQMEIFCGNLEKMGVEMENFKILLSVLLMVMEILLFVTVEITESKFLIQKEIS